MFVYLLNRTPRFLFLRCPRPYRRSLATTQAENSTVEIQGWIKKVHNKKVISFIHLVTDAAAPSVQLVVPRDVYDVKRQMEDSTVIGSAIRVRGKWVDSPGPGQDREILADSLTVVSEGSSAAIKSARTNFDLIRESLHLRAKSPAFAAVLHARSRLNFQTHRFFADRGFCQVDTSLLSLNDCEGAGETFVVNSSTDPDFFGSDPVYLPVSAQLHLEAITSGIPNVYTLSPAFRAEKSKSRHHLAEFRMLEAESAFVESLDEICDLVESFVREMIRMAQTEWADELSRLAHLLDESKTSRDHWIQNLDPSTPFPRVSYAEACRVLEQSEGGKTGGGFNKRQELFLVDHFGGGPLFVQRFPASSKPFYMRQNDRAEAECFDLLCPGVAELAGGSVREWDHDRLTRSAETQNSSSCLDWYVKLRQSGYPRSSGFGLGMDRLAQFLFGLENIKDTTAFPRWYKHCQC